ncbi:MAG: flagellar biosynthetic protein FliQ [Anaeromyxobacteraceae bacterium]
MSGDLPAGLLREGFVLLATVGAPVFVTMLLVGLVLGVLQAATQINDTAVGFLPRAAAALTVIWLFGGWMMERLSGFLAQAIARMSGG